MTYDNIKIPYPSFSMADGNFFFFNHSNNTVYKKNSKGDIIFTYAVEESLGGKQVLSTQYDGLHFWTLQEGDLSLDRVIKKWRLESYVYKVLDTIYLDSASTDYNYGIASFANESYQTTLSSGIAVGDTQVSINSKTNFVIPGTMFTLGPNTEGLYEEVTVTGTLDSSTYGLDFFTSYAHDEGTSVVFTNYLWFFNDYNHKVSQGTLSKFSLKDRAIVSNTEDNDFLTVDASAFYYDNGTSYVLFVLGTLLKFINLETLTVIKSMLMDNIRVNNTTVNTIKDIEILGDTLYRLQNYVTYYGVDYSLSNYNYQCSTLRSFVDSVTMGTYPKIVPSDGISLINATAIVQDQFSNPSVYKTVWFSDDDDEHGYITVPEPLTDQNGVARSYYRAGLSPKTVIITAFITQYD